MRTTAYCILFACLIAAGCSQMKDTRRKMTDDEKTFRANCRTCHILPKSENKSLDEWPQFLKAHAEDKDISPEDLEKIEKFLQSNSK